MPSALSGTPGRDPLARRVALIILLATLILLSLNDGPDPDLWGHVRYAEDLLAGHGVPTTPAYTFTAMDRPWVNHEYLSGLLFALAGRVGGAPGLPVLKSLVACLVFGILLAVGNRARVPLHLTAPFILLVTGNLLPWWTVRPQLFTYALFTVTIAWLDRCFESDATSTFPRRLLALPPLFALWANLHGGVIAGWCFCALYLGCRALENLAKRGREAWSTVIAFAAMCAATALATLLTPHGPAMPLWVLRVINEPRNEITEWATMSLSHPYFVGWAALVAVIVLTAALRRRAYGFTRATMLAAALWQSFLHVRHIPFLAILVGLWAPQHLAIARHGHRAALAPAGRPASPKAARRARRTLDAIAIILLVVLAVRDRALWVDKSSYPVEAVDYMAAHNLVGRSVVHFNWALYVIAALAPATSVSIDGRLDFYPQDVIDMNLDFFLGDVPGRSTAPSDLRDEALVLEYGRPDLVLLDRRFPHALELMLRQPGWVVLYQDALAQLWGRRERYDVAGAADWVPPAERLVSENEQSGFVPWPALPTRRDSES